MYHTMCYPLKIIRYLKEQMMMKFSRNAVLLKIQYFFEEPVKLIMYYKGYLIKKNYLDLCFYAFLYFFMEMPFNQDQSNFLRLKCLIFLFDDKTCRHLFFFHQQNRKYQFFTFSYVDLFCYIKLCLKIFKNQLKHMEMNWQKYKPNFEFCI